MMVNSVNISLKAKIKEWFRKKRRKHYLIKGDDNKVWLQKPKSLKHFHIVIYGNHNNIEVLTAEYFKAEIYIGTSDCPVENCNVKIEKDATSNGVMIRLLENDSSVKIGEDAMLSDKIEIYCSDTHSIFNELGELANYGHNIDIGNHVWIGSSVTICKNTEIAQGCIVGTKAVIAGKFAEPNCVIAGNSARVVKHNVQWSRERPQNYLRKNGKE